MSGGNAPLHGVILAAGAATRFGSPKQLLAVNGRSLLQRSMDTAAVVVGAQLTVVLGAHALEIATSVSAHGASIVVNRQWQEGIASSIRTGIASLPPACDGALLMLADQPLLTATGLSRLAAVWRAAPRRLVAAYYVRETGPITGAPAIFPRWCFADLLALRGDQGARQLLHRYAHDLERLELPEAAIDIDRPEDLSHLV